MRRKATILFGLIAVIALATACNSFNPPMPTYNAGADTTLPPPTTSPEATQTPAVITPNTVTASPEPDNTPDATATDDPSASSTPTPTATAAKTYVWVNGNSVNLREKATTESNKLTSYNKGKKLELIEKGDNWWKVTDGSKTGYIRKDLLSETEVKAS